MVKLFAAALLIAGVGVGCEGRGPTAPSAERPGMAALPPVVSTPPPVGVPLPPLSGAATTFRFSEPLENFGVVRVSPYTARSTFVLYESGGCTLEYADLSGQLRGRFERDGDAIRFYFGENRVGVDASGLLSGDLLEVRFSEIMQHSDFENAIYRRVE
jgi:hypothetical protein